MGEINSDERKISILDLKEYGKIQISEHFDLINSNKKWDAQFKKDPDFYDATHVVSNELINPAGPAGKFLLGLYDTEIHLSLRSKRIYHSQMPGVFKEFIEAKHIGYFIFDEKIVGCAKIRTLINPIPKTYALRALDDLIVDSITFTGNKSLEEFKEDSEYVMNYFETTQLTRNFLEALEEKNINKFHMYNFPNFSYNNEYISKR